MMTFPSYPVFPDHYSFELLPKIRQTKLAIFSTWSSTISLPYLLHIYEKELKKTCGYTGSLSKMLHSFYESDLIHKQSL